MEKRSHVYFQQYGEALRGDDGETSGAMKPHDAGGDSLPFDHLDGRRFEVLAYRLKVADAASNGRHVALMQGSGERGRDVIVYGADGRVIEVIQCKNLQDRLSEGIVLRELAKIALHAFLEPAILGEGPVQYELWSPAGFTEDAAAIIDTWPTLWGEERVKNCATTLFNKFAAFNDLFWEDVQTFVLQKIPEILRVVRVEGVDISPKVRAALPIYESFFDGRVVMDRAHVVDTLQELVTAGTAAGLERFADKDGIHILDRIASFPADKRIVGPSCYVLGLTTELVSRFRRAEYEEYARCAVASTFGIAMVAQNACVRIANEFTDDLCREVTPSNRSMFYVVRKTLTWSLLAKLNGVPMGNLRKLQPSLEQYRTLSLDERLEQHVAEIWDEYQRCLMAYKAEEHAAGSDEAIRAEIAEFALRGFSSKEKFEAMLRDDLKRFRAKIENTFSRFMRLVPDEIMVIGDSVTVFEKRMLFERMLETTSELTRLRGSAVIPE